MIVPEVASCELISFGCSANFRNLNKMNPQ